MDAQIILNFKKSTFVEKALKGSQEGSSPWAAIAGAVGLQPQIDLVQDKTVLSPWGCKSGTTLLKSGKSQTDQTKQPGAFMQPRVVTSKLGCACTEEDQTQADVCEQSTQLTLLPALTCHSSRAFARAGQPAAKGKHISGGNRYILFDLVQRRGLPDRCHPNKHTRNEVFNFRGR